MMNEHSHGDDAIEVRLRRWGESSTGGRTVTFELPPDGEHPFKHLPVGKDGQRMALAVALIGDDERQAPLPVITTEKPKRHFDDTPRAEQAGMKCKDKTFVDWLWTRGRVLVGKRDSEKNGETAQCWAVREVRARCGVASRRQLDDDSAAAGRWDVLLAEYYQDTGQTAEARG